MEIQTLQRERICPIVDLEIAFLNVYSNAVVVDNAVAQSQIASAVFNDSTAGNGSGGNALSIGSGCNHHSGTLGEIPSDAIELGGFCDVNLRIFSKGQCTGPSHRASNNGRG